VRVVALTSCLFTAGALQIEDEKRHVHGFTRLIISPLKRSWYALQRCVFVFMSRDACLYDSFDQLKALEIHLEIGVMSCWTDMYWFYSNYLPLLMVDSTSGAAAAAAEACLPPFRLTVSAQTSDDGAPRSVLLGSAPRIGEGDVADGAVEPYSYFQECFSVSGLFTRKIDIKV
jgi:hypothetical protein